MAENRENALEMVVESVRVQMSTGRHVLLLKEVGVGRILPIWIGPWEASAIAMRLQGVTPERPLTHDLLGTVITTLGARPERIVIVSLADETFHATLELATADARYEVDARPSDAIALAVRMDIPIFASSEVLDRAAKMIDLEDDDEADEGGEDAGPGESLGGPVDSASLAIFRDFVNSLDFEDKGKNS
ncbi:MAG: bifunctional nuclease family protein [Chloroflexota bacterium]